ncbi:mechanosensitive ion channel family protein [Algoriphagus antarcticus]|uniref:Small conductance mechanosensitive channel n=1 Tax=Algoriphagus antarcticus TaxID=238540 RepID=A0A3E0DMQ2_9BACT|nr:mechanosensitive ion channel domain-containing protein [Algoriphagus antarcticus]REG84064.1 small conductance mechanosensitive channel [Algoriphagus antarcticus]
MEFSQETVNAFYERAIDLAYLIVPRIIFAVIFYLIGKFIINALLKGLRNLLENRETNPSLNEFLFGFVKIILYITLFMGVASILGAPLGSTVAIFGAAGLAIGLALQGSLSNFAGGILILGFKPFKVGDVIVAQGHTGTVAKIQILYTHLMTFDNLEVVIPNGSLANSDIINMSTQATRRTEFKVGVAYGTNIKQAKEILLNIFENDPRALQDPAPFVALTNFGDSSLDMVVRVWAKSSEMWPMHFDGMEAINTEFEKAGIEIPFPQRVVYQIKEKASEEESNS